MKKFNQKGFGAIEVLLIFVIFAIIGGVGYYVYGQTRTNSDLAQKSNAPAEKEETPAPAVKDETADWLVYEAPNNEYSVKIPDGWKLDRHNDSSDLVAFSSEGAVYKPGIKATIGVYKGGGRGGPFAFQLVVGSDDMYNERRGEAQKYTTSNGLVGERRTFTQTEEGGHDLSNGEKEYKYYIKKGSTPIVIVYSVFAGQEDQSTTVDKMVKTLVIK